MEMEMNIYEEWIFQKLTSLVKMEGAWESLMKMDYYICSNHCNGFGHVTKLLNLECNIS